jgi:hypothetical protein
MSRRGQAIELVTQAIPWMVVAAGVAFTLYLQTLVPDLVFFNGDGGLKALLVRQFAAGHFRADLVFDVPSWTRTLWDQGLYPFKPPYVYAIDGKHYLQFPLALPIVTAPLFRWFGYQGLTLLPLVATWGAWVTLGRTSLRLGADWLAISVGLACFIFASPLTLYSAMFWEHSIAVCLAFWGLVALLPCPGACSRLRSGCGGAALGLAIWFREEVLFLVAILALIGGVGLLRKEQVLTPGSKAFIFGLSLGLAWFFGFNQLVYGFPLGTHAFAALRTVAIDDRGSSMLMILGELSRRLIITFPLVLLMPLLPIAWSLARANERPNLPAKAWLLTVAVLFPLIFPALLPDTSFVSFGGKQWGPRFWLLVVPIVSLLTTLTLASARGAMRILLYAGALTCLTFGAHMNVSNGARLLAADYAGRVRPALVTLRASPIKDIVAGGEWIVQELAAALPDRAFYLAEDGHHEQLELLAPALFHQSREAFLYVAYVYAPTVERFLAMGQAVEDLGEHGSYRIYRVGTRLPSQVD